LDIVLVITLAIGFAAVVSEIVSFDQKLEKLEGYYTEYSEKYDIDLEIYTEEFNKLSKEEQDAYNKRVEEANAALNEDEEALELYHSIIVLLLFNVTVSTLVAYLALEFAVPLLLGNGQTLGKKIFGVALMRADGVKVRPVQMFVRSILGKFTLETMIPILVIGMIITNVTGTVGIMVLLAIAILEVFVYVKSGTNSLIHDVVAVTVCIDLQSQLIFETEEELIAYKEKTAAENVGKMGRGAESSTSVYSSVNSIEVNTPDRAVADSTDSSTEFSGISLGTISVGDETYVNTAVSTAEVEDKSDEILAPDREEEIDSQEEAKSAEEADMADEETESASEESENREESEESENVEESEESEEEKESEETEEA
jgi:uncharacterized RDD family membrane protein YckC